MSGLIQPPNERVIKNRNCAAFLISIIKIPFKNWNNI